MSLGGRGRGYGGRHHAREPRPGHAAAAAAGDDDTTRPPPPLSPTDNLTAAESCMEQQVSEAHRLESELDAQYTRMQQEDEAALKELLHIDEQYKPLLLLLEQFSAGEDGIQFNRKLRHFETTIAGMCPDETRLLEAFATFRGAALLSGTTARKLAAAGASFTRQQRQATLRTALLNVVMQGTFAKLDVLERANPQYLINAANLIGDYFAEARLCNGNKVHIVAAPLLQYLRALLHSDHLRAHRSLATQLMQNGRELLSVLSQELDELSISIRKRLLTPPPVSIVWLLLSADLCLNKFLPLPNTLQQFYASHLDLAHEESFSEVNYGSWKESPKKDENDLSLAEKVSQNISQLNLSQEENGMKPKLRPILGAGAGLMRQEQSVTQDNYEWTGKSLSKRYDLNSWRQNGDEKEEPAFNPTVLPPSFEFPPPNVASVTQKYQTQYQEPQYSSYLQQGDGAYIQSTYQEPTNINYQQGDGFNTNMEREKIRQADRAANPERVNNEVQKSAKKIENWRNETSETEINRNEEEKIEELRKSTQNLRARTNRRDSIEEKKKTPMDVPRSNKYWDHDDRCDIDYNS